MKWKEFAKDLIDQYKLDEVDALAASLAYFAAFSIVPMMLLATIVGGVFFGADTTRAELIGQLQNLLGESGAAFVADAVKNSSQLTGSGNIIASIVGVLLVLAGASKFFAQFQLALNRVWNVRLSDSVGIQGTLKKRALSFGLIGGIAILMLVSTIASALISGVVNAVNLPGGTAMVEAANVVITLVLSTGLFVVVYKYLPDAEVRWRDVRLGAAVTAVFLLVGKIAIGLYIGQGSLTSTYGAAASIIVFLVWVYYSMQIVLIGAEFTQVWASRHGRAIVPEPQAEPAY